jgi:hypothetical protein
MSFCDIILIFSEFDYLSRQYLIASSEISLSRINLSARKEPSAVTKSLQLASIILSASAFEENPANYWFN